MLYKKLGIEKKDSHLMTTVYCSYFTTGAINTVLGAILPYLKDAHDLNYWLVGNLYASHQIGNLCAVFLTGILPYIIGRKKTATILYSFLILGVVFITIFGSPLPLLISFAMTGIGRGVMSNTTNIEVLEKTKNKTAGLNVLHAIFATGAFFAPFLLLVASKFNENLGWKISLWFVAAISTVILINYIFSTLKNQKEVRKTTTASGEKIVPFYKSFDYWLTMLIMLFYLCEEAGASGWLVTFFKDSGILTADLAGITTSVLWLSVMVGRFLCALISGRVGKIRLLLILAFSNLASFILMIATKNVYVCFAGIVLTGFTMSGLYPTTVSTMKLEYSSSPLSAGIAMGAAILGGIFMPSIVGAVAEVSGVTAGISTIAVALGIMTALIVVKAIRGSGASR